jgi:hypothetical protein
MAALVDVGFGAVNKVSCLTGRAQETYVYPWNGLRKHLSNSNFVEISMVNTAGAIDGAIIGGLVGAALYPFFIMIAKQKQKTGKAMGKPTIRDIFWPGSLDEALERGQYVLQQQKAKIISVNRATGSILAGTGGNWRSTGSTVQVFVRPQQGGFQVVVQAAPTMSLYDSGFSRSFTNNFVEAWTALGHPRGAGGPGQFVV